MIGTNLGSDVMKSVGVNHDFINKVYLCCIHNLNVLIHKFKQYLKC